jgi:hypothetical protein
MLAKAQAKYLVMDLLERGYLMAQRVTYKSSDGDGYNKQDIPSHDQGTPAVSAKCLDDDSDVNPLLDKNSFELNFEAYKAEAEKQYKGAGIGDLDEKKQEGIFDGVQTCFEKFFDGLSALGRDEKSPESTSIVAGMATAIAGASLFTMLVPTLHTVCSKFASVFNSSTDEVARTVFSGLCIVSSGIRAALPISAEMARRANNQEEVLIFSIATVVMASVYLATSSISVLLASHSAILESPTTAKMALKLKKEIESTEKEQDSENFSEFASQSLQKIEEMLTGWKADASANLLSFGKEFLLFSGAVLSIFSAISKFVPNLAIPFVSIIAGSISLFANVFELRQGMVEYRNQKAKLESLKKELNKEENPSKAEEIKKQISKLESQLKVSIIRIAKGVLNVIVSVANIVLGILMTLSLLSPPAFFLASAILTAVSLASVLVLSAGSLVVRKMNNVGSAGNAPSAITAKNADGNDTDETKETESENESIEEEDLNRSSLNQKFNGSKKRSSTSGYQNVSPLSSQSQQKKAVMEYV